MINKESLLNVTEGLWVSEYFLAITPDIKVLELINSIKKEIYVGIGNFELRQTLPCVKLLSLSANSAYTSKLIALLRDSIAGHSAFQIQLAASRSDFSEEELSISIDLSENITTLADTLFMKLCGQFNVRQTSFSIAVAKNMSVDRLAAAQQIIDKIDLERSFDVTSVTLFKQSNDGSFQALHDFRLS